MTEPNDKLPNHISRPVDDVSATTPEDAVAPQPKPRVFGLHAGLVGWDPTFDDELPDSFWLGYDEEKEKYDSNT